MDIMADIQSNVDEVEFLRLRVKELETENKLLKQILRNHNIQDEALQVLFNSEVITSKNNSSADEEAGANIVKQKSEFIKSNGHKPIDNIQAFKHSIDDSLRENAWNLSKSRKIRTKRSKKKKKKSVENNTDWSMYSRRHVALQVMYLGENYHGFASQGKGKKTVEGELLSAMERTKLLVDSPTDALYSRCGRTDKGVNAHCQVIAIYLRSISKKRKQEKAISSPSDETEEKSRRRNEGEDDSVEGEEGRVPEGNGAKEEEETGSGGAIPWKEEILDRKVAALASREEEAEFYSKADWANELDYVAILNRALPIDIRVVGWSPVPPGFSARFSCHFREYLYFFVQEDLNIAAMREAAAHFCGSHDFRNFCKMDALNVVNYERSIRGFEVEERGSLAGRPVWALRVNGTAFLWHQVRCMAAVLFMVGRGQEHPQIVSEMLDLTRFPRKPQYSMASEAPLVLNFSGFNGLSFRCAEKTRQFLLRDVEGLLEASIVKTMVLHSTVSQIQSPGEPYSSKAAHIPLCDRLTEPTYEERRTRRAGVKS